MSNSNAPALAGISIKLWSFVKDNVAIVTSILLFLLVSSFLIFPSSRTLNPDAIEYIVIANHYLNLDLSIAINGIWSPLLSWVLVLPLSLNIDPLVFFRLSQIFISILIILIFDKISFLVFKIHGKNSSLVRLSGLFFITAFCLYSSFFTPLTPDLYSVLVVLTIGLFYLKHSDQEKTSYLVVIGLLSGVSFYVKSYLMYFSIACILLFFAYQYYSKRRSLLSVSRLGFVPMLICVLIVSPWIILQSIKNQKLTVNPIGGYAMSQVGPNYPGAPVTTLGLLTPPYANSITAREDPTRFEYEEWSPTQSLNDLRYYAVKILPVNILDALQLFIPILAPVVTSFFILFVQSRSKALNAIRNPTLVAIIAAASVFTSGYCLVHIAGGFRYLWPSYVMLFIAFLLIAREIRGGLRSGIIIVGTLTASLFPLYEAFPKITISQENSAEIKSIAQAISKKTDLQQGSNLATNEPYQAAQICYYLKLRCYGLPSRHQVTEGIHKAGIDYYLQFNNRPDQGVTGNILYQDADLSLIELR